MRQLPGYLPLFDPDNFPDVEFYRELERIGYREVLIGGTGSATLDTVLRGIKRETDLQIVLYPSGPDAVNPRADLVLLPDVMNSNSHFARPFGSGPISTALNIARQGIAYLPVAYMILGNSTARWYYDAFLLPSTKIVIGYATYAAMIGYHHVALDYEDPHIAIEAELITKLREIPGIALTVSDEFTPETAAEARSLGIDTVVTPSDTYETSVDPLALAAEFYARLLR